MSTDPDDAKVRQLGKLALDGMAEIQRLSGIADFIVPTEYSVDFTDADGVDWRLSIEKLVTI